jgi:hypothetical protein
MQLGLTTERKQAGSLVENDARRWRTRKPTVDPDAEHARAQRFETAVGELSPARLAPRFDRYLADRETLVHVQYLVEIGRDRRRHPVREALAVQRARREHAIGTGVSMVVGEVGLVGDAHSENVLSDFLRR